ncbi:MAG: hypothetical protein AAB038_00675 [Planctomycetota bacterium]
MWPKKSFDIEYRGCKIVVNENGFIAIGVNEKTQALKMLNEIMATALLLNIPFYAVKELELGTAEISPDKSEIGSRSMPMHVSLRTTAFEGEFTPKQRTGYDFNITREISEEQVKETIKQAELFTKNETIAELLIYLLESYSYLQGSEYNQTFIMGWMVIEKFINYLWDKFLEQKSTEIIGDRKNKLKNYTADRAVEILSLSGQINFKQYSLIIQMKNKRNRFLHKGEKVLEEDAKTIFKIESFLTKWLIWEILWGKGNSVEVPEFEVEESAI